MVQSTSNGRWRLLNASSNGFARAFNACANWTRHLGSTGISTGTGSCMSGTMPDVANKCWHSRWCFKAMIWSWCLWTDLA